MMLAMFGDEPALSRAVARFREAGVGPVETYTPAPPKDADTSSPIPVVTMLAGLLGAAASFALQAWSHTVAYPLNVGGRPDFAWPSFIPTAFENGVLIAVAAGFFAYFAVNRMPRLYEPIDEVDAFREASRDGWFLAVQAKDATALKQARALLEELHPARIDEVPE